MCGYFIFIFILFHAVVAQADFVELDASRLSILNYQGLQIGQPPDPGMVCIKGNCLSKKNDDIEILKNPVSTYVMAEDKCLFDNVKITIAEYSYFKDRLFRIVFRLECSEINSEACITSAVKAFNDKFDLTLLVTTKIDYVALGISHMFYEYVTKSGALISINQEFKSGKPVDPQVEIFDKGLMDEVILSVNPEYKPKRILVPTPR